MGDVMMPSGADNRILKNYTTEGSARMTRGTSEVVFTAIMVLVLFALYLGGIAATVP